MERSDIVNEMDSDSYRGTWITLELSYPVSLNLK
jgi:hypothetical protein